MIVELEGLEVFGRHGVLEEEQREGQTFLFDITLDVRPPTADRIEDAVDYREVAALVEHVSGSRRFNLLESLAVAVADSLAARFPAAQVRVRVRKPRPRGVPAAWLGATAERQGASRAE